MSEQDNGRVAALQHPITNDSKEWLTYWYSQGQGWRREPEIDRERQKYLSERFQLSFRSQFNDVILSRADVEWLLATAESENEHSSSDKIRWIRLRLNLEGADLRNVDLSYLPLEMADFTGAHLEGANLIKAQLGGADLREVFFDATTKLNDVDLWDDKHGGVLLADVHWGDVNLAVVDWSKVLVLGDEQTMRGSIGTMPVPRWASPKPRRPITRNRERRRELRAFDTHSGSTSAVRAYRQLVVVLRNQGLNEDAAHFAYRGQLIQRQVLYYQDKFGQYLFSLFLDLLSGYGYKPIRSFIAYLIVITAFAAAYFIISQHVRPALSPLGSVFFSMTSFHGRGFFPGGIGLDDPLTVVAALEAFVGLLIEVTFIATLTQRLFGK